MEKTNNEVTIVCNYPAYKGECFQRLNLFGKDQMNVFPQVSLLAEYFQEVKPRLIDFIEISTFIYVADQRKVRCQNIVDPHALRWHRKFNMIIAVRDIDFWNRADVKKTLERLLQFLSDDKYCFQFVKMTENHPQQQYLIFDNKMCARYKPERIMLFSGGLDSLGGAVESLLGDGVSTVLVRHNSSSKHKERYDHIENELKRRSGDRSILFTFKARKDGKLSKEYTQRTRSILYFAFAAVIANLLGIDEVRFYENGPVSLNLPMNPQVVGGKATRTTHPQTLFFFQKLFSLISEKPDFKVINPFIDKTKSEIIKLIIGYNCGDLIKDSMSCAHSWQQSKIMKHCGVCSQCIDRRVAIIAAGAEHLDNEKDYVTDFFTESVDSHSGEFDDYFDAPNKNLLASYFLRGKQIRKLDCDQFQIKFPEINSALLYMGKDPLNAAQDIFLLYRRLADDIQAVVQYAQAPKYLEKLSDIDNPLPDDCLLRLLTRKTQSKVIETKVVSEKLQNYMFVRRGNGWLIRFNGGEEKYQPHLDGCDIIARLLEAPNTYIDYYELFPGTLTDDEPFVDGDEMMDSMTISKRESYAPVSDEKAILAIKARINDLQLLMQDPGCPLDRKEEYEEETEKLTRHLNSIIGKGGKPRNVNKTEKRKRDRCRSLVKSVIDSIKVFDPNCAEHLKRNISYGTAPKYTNPNPEVIKWVVSRNP